MYCTQQIIQGENFHDWLKTAKTAKVFPFESFAVYGILLVADSPHNYAKWLHMQLLPPFILYIPGFPTFPKCRVASHMH